MAIAAVTGLWGTPAAAAPTDDDGFTVYTTDHMWCGSAEFVDYGPGAPGGGNNDDYVEVKDGCPDRVGVKAWAWLDGRLLGSKYVGPGIKTVVWDPFGNVRANQEVGLKVCKVSGNNDPTPTNCEAWSTVSNDG